MPNITRTRIDCAANPQGIYTITGLDSDVYAVEITFHDVGIPRGNSYNMVVQLSNDGGSTWLDQMGDYHYSTALPWPGSPASNTSGGDRSSIVPCKQWYLDPYYVTFSGFCKIAGTGYAMNPVFRVGSVSETQTAYGAWVEGGQVRSTAVQTAIRITTDSPGRSLSYTTGTITVLVYRASEYDTIIFKNYSLLSEGPFTIPIPYSNCEVDVVWSDLNINQAARIPVVRFSADGTTVDTGTNYTYHRQTWLIAVGSLTANHGTMTVTSGPGADTWDGWFKFSGLRDETSTLWRGVTTNRGNGYNVEWFAGEHTPEVAQNFIWFGAHDYGNFDAGQVLLCVTGDSSG